ncbi:hypothetical protein KIN20_013941, partial [Parelaphostrongylus tenuis]
MNSKCAVYRSRPQEVVYLKDPNVDQVAVCIAWAKRKKVQVHGVDIVLEVTINEGDQYGRTKLKLEQVPRENMSIFGLEVGSAKRQSLWLYFAVQYSLTPVSHDDA